MTDREDDKPAPRYQPADDGRTDPRGAPVHGGGRYGTTEPVNGGKDDPLMPPGAERTT